MKNVVFVVVKYHELKQELENWGIAKQNKESDFSLLEYYKEQEGSLLKNLNGFELIIKDSSQKRAGKGLFISGSAKKGQIIGFYPGLVFPMLNNYAIWQTFGNNHPAIPHNTGFQLMLESHYIIGVFFLLRM